MAVRVNLGLGLLRKPTERVVFMHSSLDPLFGKRNSRMAQVEVVLGALVDWIKPWT